MMEEVHDELQVCADCAECDFASEAPSSIFTLNEATSDSGMQRVAFPLIRESHIAEVQVHRVGLLIFTIVPGGYAVSTELCKRGLDSAPGWMLVYQKAGVTDGERGYDGAITSVRFQSDSCPETGRNLAGDTMLVHFPRATFKGLETHIEAICDGTADFTANALLPSYLESLWDCLPKLTESEQLIVEAVTNKLVRSCIARIQDSVVATSAASRSRLESAKQYIEERITSPSLTIESVQNWLGVSRRQLYSLFESYGGVARYIMSQRLKKCHVAINDPEEQRPIGRIAEQYRIDPSRVVSLFRQEFGYGPDQARSGVQYGHASGVLSGDTAECVVRAA